MKNMNYLFTLKKFIFYFIFSLDTPQLFKNNNYGYITVMGGGDEKSEADALKKKLLMILLKMKNKKNHFR